MDNSVSNYGKGASLHARLTLKIKDEIKLDIDKSHILNQREQIQILREKYNKQCFNKKITGFYIDLNNCQKQCQETIYRSTKLVKTVLKKLTIPFHKCKTSSRHLSQGQFRKRLNGSRIPFSILNNNNLNCTKVNNTNIQNQVEITTPMLDYKGEKLTRNTSNPFMTGANKIKYSTQSSLSLVKEHRIPVF